MVGKTFWGLTYQPSLGLKLVHWCDIDKAMLRIDGKLVCSQKIMLPVCGHLGITLRAAKWQKNWILIPETELRADERRTNVWVK